MERSMDMLIISKIAISQEQRILAKNKGVHLVKLNLRNKHIASLDFVQNLERDLHGWPPSTGVGGFCWEGCWTRVLAAKEVLGPECTTLGIFTVSVVSGEMEFKVFQG